MINMPASAMNTEPVIAFGKYPIYPENDAIPQLCRLTV